MLQVKHHKMIIFISQRINKWSSHTVVYSVTVNYTMEFSYRIKQKIEI